MEEKQSEDILYETVISNGYCVGCGVCSAPKNSPFKIIMDKYGQYISEPVEKLTVENPKTNYNSLCPFGNESKDEDEIAKDYFSEDCNHNKMLGYYNSIYAGHVSEGDFRKNGSSGGMGSWLLHELLNKNVVDYIVHVKSKHSSSDVNNIPFHYQVSNSPGDIRRGGKSRYYPAELSEALHTIRNQPGRYAIIGLPCFIKGVRLLQSQDPIYAERIQYCIGLVCGHLKSAHYAESLAWQMGVNPSDLKAIDFRVKDSSQPANCYSTYAKGSSKEKTIPTKQLLGADWGGGALKYKACDFCDDVFAETADIAIGDAWLPEYVHDSNGTNLVLTRNLYIKKLITDALSDRRLILDEISSDRAAMSQDAGLRHRKGAIGYRLHIEKTKSSWVPKKRISPSTKIRPKHEINRQKIRSEIRDLSRDSFLMAKKRNDLSFYTESMQPIFNELHHSNKKPLRNKIILKIKNFIYG